MRFTYQRWAALIVLAVSIVTLIAVALSRLTLAPSPPHSTPGSAASNHGPAGATPTPISDPTSVTSPTVRSGPSETAPRGTEVPPPTPAPTNTPRPTQTPAPPTATPIPTPTRRPIRITKLGMGVYDSGGAMLPALDELRPSVILLMDPADDFAREVRQRFPKAFIVGRIFAPQQPLDNPGARGTAFADQVAQSAVPLKGVIDAWMSYNELGSPEDIESMVNYNAFQVAFAHRLQDVHGIPAVCNNDGPRAIPADLYPRYYADAIRTCKYFGVHVYPDKQFKSLRDPAAADQVFYYRKIYAALQAAGVPHGPFIITEVGLWDGWREVTSDVEMANDFIWFADQLNQDSYVLGMTIFGLFADGRSEWLRFNVDHTAMLRMLGDYNTEP